MKLSHVLDSLHIKLNISGLFLCNHRPQISSMPPRWLSTSCKRQILCCCHAHLRIPFCTIYTKQKKDSKFKIFVILFLWWMHINQISLEYISLRISRLVGRYLDINQEIISTSVTALDMWFKRVLSLVCSCFYLPDFPWFVPPVDLPACVHVHACVCVCVC